MRLYSSLWLFLIAGACAHAQGGLSQLATAVSKVDPGYNVSNATQNQLNSWFDYAPSSSYLLTSFKDDVLRYPGTGSLQKGTLHAVLTLLKDDQLTTDTIIIESTTVGGSPDNGVRTSSNSVRLNTQSFSTYASWLAAVQNPSNGYIPVKLYPYDFLTFKDAAGRTLTLGPLQTFTPGQVGSSTMSTTTADVKTPLSYFIMLVWDVKTN